jgi:predicted transcriptional regulator of viral defense system
LNFQSFRLSLSAYPVFSTTDIRLIFPGFDLKNLVNWQAKGYLLRIRNGWYQFIELNLTAEFVYFASNQVYQPSYVSLETALSFYGFIPEGVFQTTCISTLKTNQFDTPIGHFSYRNIKPRLFFGYNLVSVGNVRYKMASPEKAISDYLYLHPELQTIAHFEGLRWNAALLVRTISMEVFREYLLAFDSVALGKRAKVLLKFLEEQNQQYA